MRWSALPRLTPYELEVIRTLPAHSHCFLIRQSDTSVVVRLDLSGMPEVLTVLSGSETTVRKLDQLREWYSDDPAAWYPHLTGAAWPGDARDEAGGEMPPVERGKRMRAGR
jgi:type IV secretion system protein VirB4